ncbi:MAG: family 20 glycosylhydrolase [Pirellulales bacterium]
METLKDSIELLRLAKIRYLHLHLSDFESCTFTSRAFPKFATPGRSFTIEQWKDLVRYADDRGVTIIPEIDMPGHAGSWVGSVPEVFGTTDANGKPKSTGVVNMASEKAYEGIDTLIGELCEIFRSSPYIHIGADEVSADGLKALPEYAVYSREHGLKLATDGQAHELLCHFVVRVDEIVRKHGRKSIVWSGFPHRGTANVKIPKDIVIMAWDAQPQDFLAAGFQVVNCCWLPLYMVPPQTRAPTAEMIIAWNTRKFDSWEWDHAIQLPADAPIFGAQLCLWEQRYNEVVPIISSRIFALSERTWSANTSEGFGTFEKRRESAAKLSEKILHPVAMSVRGTIEPQDSRFEDKLEVTLSSIVPGTVIRYELDTPWETFPTAESKIYVKPLMIGETTTVSARLFGADGKPLGGITQRRFAKTESIYRYCAFSPIPRHGWKEFPDFAEMKPSREGVMGRLTTDRAQQINRAMFAGVRERGHIDVRLEDYYNPYAIELQGTLKIETPGEYTFLFESRDGEARLMLDDQVLTSAAKLERKLTFKVGEHSFTIRHYFRAHTNDLNLQVKSPGADSFIPFETLVVPLKNRAFSQDDQR